MERYEVKSTELHPAFDPEQPGLTTVYIASEVDALAAEGKLTANAQRDAVIEAMEKSHQRYEKLRRLSPREFHSLWMQSIAGDRFDDLVDRLPS